MKYLSSYSLFEEAQLKVDSRLDDFISNTEDECYVSKVLSQMMYSHKYVTTFNNLRVVMSDIIRVSPQDRENQDIDMKVGRLIKKFSTDNNRNISDRDIERFVDLYKSYFTEIDSYTFKVVQGEEIRFWYSSDNYAKFAIRNTLGKSCMSYKHCQPWLDIYVKNPSVCKLVILLDADNKLCARALLWKDTSGNYLLDRVYYIHSYQEELLKKWARDKFEKLEIIKKVNNQKYKVQLTEWDFGGDRATYPFMDNLYYLQLDNGLLSASGDSYEKKHPTVYLQAVYGYPVSGPNSDIWVYSNPLKKWIYKLTSQRNDDGDWVPDNRFISKFRNFKKKYWDV